MSQNAGIEPNPIPAFGCDETLTIYYKPGMRVGEGGGGGGGG